jgi:predicted nucleotidyltransferase
LTPDLDVLAKLCEREWPGVLFATVSGAHLYGFPSEDSDVDVRGCFRAPLADRLGLRPGPETREVQCEADGREVELVAHEVGKYFRLLVKHNGYILEQIFSPLVVTGQTFLDELRPLARRCVTRGCHHHYRGFLNAQMKLLEKQPVKTAKALLYAYRVALTGIHLLTTGEVEANLLNLNTRFRLPFIDELIERKKARETGVLTDLDWNWHKAELADWERRLDSAFEQSSLPAEAPIAEVNDYLIRLRLNEVGPELAEAIAGRRQLPSG